MNLTNAHSLPEALYRADAVQALDRCAIETQGIDGFDLMHRAARAAFRQLLRHWPHAARVAVLCGGGNNGGDGYLVAANAYQKGMAVDCVAVTDPDRLKGDARRAFDEATSLGVPIEPVEAVSDKALFDRLCASDAIVDALLGTGITGAPRAPFDRIIQRVNRAGIGVLAVDVPSGLNASTGLASGDVIHARVTPTFIGLKAGLMTGDGPDCAGDVVFDDLGVPEATYDAASPVARCVNWRRASTMLAPRRRGAHKGECGHLLVVAGEQGLGGAGILAAEAAARTGAGLVTLATRPEHVSAALTRCPSLMVRGVTHGNDLCPLLSGVDGVVFGPGAGQGPWGQQMMQQVLARPHPLVLDADALNLMASRAPARRENQVLTPHPGEAARLLGITTSEIADDRLAAADRLQERFGGVALLKGVGTVVQTRAERPAVIEGGNPGMATGGMGDVLSGIIGSLLVQGLPAFEAAWLGASLHAEAGDRAARKQGQRGLLPMDLIGELPACLSDSERVGAPGSPADGEE
ncbi:bifunctional ADP-dependent NAD(P)H-hydrate dehydratase/NAD(P)H-hydrate epimerase [Tamilnaduibacter salinus]|uniref:Bifunctional NAD(P)H-hydrate repair enzyme n=1 Tax=Tamilnaduibacter salinus TaxID=1484056 RepID=A0A2A2I5P9_9GAMM|nr:NAD(P)H-hydrate dehydratase [Tamilnaduibacter salinus]PAV26465.1 bifunctional ADP-dependent NAD(P)H-hydrate dehydratase/NAD(P)H-hydrate epimerase [Tamilnaduibacter salinus]